MKVYNMRNKGIVEPEKRIKRKEEKLRKKQLKEAIKYQRVKEKIEIKNSKLPSTIFKWVFLAIVIIILMTFFIIGMMCLDNINGNRKENISVNSVEVKIEAALLASGLSIIGIAISVWVGLNVIQILGRDKFLLLSREVEKHSKERFETNRQNFIARIRAFDNIINHYLSNKIQMLDYSEEMHDLYFQLIEIENLFQSVFMQQYLIERNIPIKEYDDAIRKCEMLLKKVEKNEYTNKEFFVEYLFLHIAEFYFYKGYLEETLENSICYEKAIYNLESIYTVLREPKLLGARDYINDDICYTAIMLNTVGEAYSKILDYTNKTKSKGKEIDFELMEAYFERLERLIEENYDHNLKGLRREVYYRNYGKAIERRMQYTGQKVNMGEKWSEKVRSLYKMALDIALSDNREQIRYKTFRAYLDFYYKMVENMDMLKLLDYGKKVKNEQRVTEYSEQAMFYAELAYRIFPRKLIFLKYVIYIRCKFCICMLIKKENKRAISYIKKVKNDMRNIENVEDYSNEEIFDFGKLKCEIERISEYISLNLIETKF